jgi:COP9 signalosome complex subunit 1
LDFEGRTRFERLFFIGQHSVSLCIDALKAAVLEAKRGRDIDHYRLAQEKLAAVAPLEPEAAYDKEWMDRVVRENNAQTKRLEDELKGYKNNLIKESVRVSHIKFTH